MKYHIYLFILLFTFCNLFGGDFPEQPENLSADNARQAKRKANRKARYEREKQSREEDPELLAQHKVLQKAANERAKRKREENPKLLAQYKAKYKARDERAKRKREEDPKLLAQHKAKQEAANEKAKRKREEDPKLLAQYKAKQKTKYERAKRKREERLKAATPPEEFYSLSPRQNFEEEALQIRSFEEMENEWLKNQPDDLLNQLQPERSFFCDAFLNE
ncbi:MAG TPA: hypothetical protein QGF02_00435 [Candidatus Babeliales bacterium]|nr:hypothetical protein [Candidatus Babeliales bacterium]